MLSDETRLEQAERILTPALRTAIDRIPDIESRRIQDIRLRLGRNLSVTIFDKEYFVDQDGVLSNSPDKAVKVTAADIDTVFKNSFRNSLHSFSRELSQGYITISGGSRVGFCGQAVINPLKDSTPDSVKNVSSINIRIAREIYGCSNEIYRKTFAAGGKSLLIIGPPCSGKTTVLRDLCRLLGDEKRISLIDERNEISSSVDGEAQNNVGMLTDVFCSYEKYNGIMTAVKVMSPKILVCDEIGSKEDTKALEYAVNSGVELVATAHCPDYDDARKRVTIARLLKCGVFDYTAVLGTGTMCGKLIRLVRSGDKND